MGILDVEITDEQTLYLDPIYEGMGIAFMTSEETRQEYYKASADHRTSDGFHSNVRGLISGLEKLSTELAKHPCAARYRNADGSFKDEYTLKYNGEPVLNKDGKAQLDVAKVRYAEGERFDRLEARRNSIRDAVSGITHKSGGDTDHRDQQLEIANRLDRECVMHSRNPIFFGPIEESWRLFGGTKHTRKEIIEEGDLIGFEALKDKFTDELRGVEDGLNRQGEQVSASHGFHNGEDITAAHSALYSSVMLRLQGDAQYVASQVYAKTEIDGDIKTSPSPLMQKYEAALAEERKYGYEQKWSFPTSRPGPGTLITVPTVELTRARAETKDLAERQIYMPNFDALTVIKEQYQRRYNEFLGQTHAIQTSDLKDDDKLSLQRAANREFEKYTADAHIRVTRAEGRYNYDAKNPAIHPSIGKGLITAGVIGVSIAAPMVAVKYAGVSMGTALLIDGAFLAADIAWHDELYLLFYTEDELHSGKIKAAYMAPLSEVHKGLHDLLKTSADLKVGLSQLNTEYSKVSKEYEAKVKDLKSKVAEYRKFESSGASNEELTKLYDELGLKDLGQEIHAADAMLKEMNTEMFELYQKRTEVDQEFRRSDNKYAVFYTDLRRFDKEMQAQMDTMGLSGLFELNKGGVKEPDNAQATDSAKEIAKKDPDAFDFILKPKHILQGDDLKEAAIEFILSENFRNRDKKDPSLTEAQLNETVRIQNIEFIRRDTMQQDYLSPGTLIWIPNDSGAPIAVKVGPEGSVLTRENLRREAEGQTLIDPQTNPFGYTLERDYDRSMEKMDFEAMANAFTRPLEPVEGNTPSEESKDTDGTDSPSLDSEGENEQSIPPAQIPKAQQTPEAINPTENSPATPQGARR